MQGLEKGSDPCVILDARRRLDAGRYIDAERLNLRDRLRHVVRRQAAREDGAVTRGNRSRNPPIDRPPGSTAPSGVADVQQHRDPLVLLVALQRSPRPIVADLRLPGPAPPT